MTNESTVTVLGLGKMGQALARRFLDSGYRVTVWNRSPDKAAPLVADGATLAEDVAAAVDSSSVIIVCLLNDDAVRATLEPVADELAGRTVINLTSDTPNQATDLSGWFERVGVVPLSGGIMATPDLIDTPHSVILYSGTESAFTENRELLERLGSAEYHGTDPGAASLHDIALLSAMYGMFAGALHSFAMVKAAGHSAESFLPMLRSFLQAMEQSLPDYADRIDRADYTTNVGSPLAMQASGYPMFMRAAEELGVRTDLLTNLGDMLNEAVGAGHGDADMAVVYELLRSAR